MLQKKKNMRLKTEKNFFSLFLTHSQGPGLLLPRPQCCGDSNDVVNYEKDLIDGAADRGV